MMEEMGLTMADSVKNDDSSINDGTTASSNSGNKTVENELNFD